MQGQMEEKVMHSQFPRYLDKDHIDMEFSFKRMNLTILKEGTETLIMAIQDQALNSKLQYTYLSVKLHLDIYVNTTTWMCKFNISDNTSLHGQYKITEHN